PYAPLHHVLMKAVGRPVVATSGNLSEEPIITDDAAALAKLGKIADAFLRHDRPIARPCDDSVARCAERRVTLLRRARGYAPMPVRVALELPATLAVGAHQKSTVAIARGREVFVGQHIGDLDTEEARAAFRSEIDDLCRLYEFRPTVVVRDLHPDYYSTLHAETLGLPIVAVQHHHAHVAACAAENGIDEPYLGVAWDGTGYGSDGTVWGGEFFVCAGRTFERVAHLRPFALLGGERAIREGRRVAFGLLQTIGRSGLPEGLGLSDHEAETFRTMLDRGLNAPTTTSAGRLFDGVAALAGVALENRFEGQAAMALEAVVDRNATRDLYPTDLTEGDRLELDWRPMIAAVVRDVERGLGAGVISTRFHNSLAEWVVAVARRMSVCKVVLSGGVFQNGYLVERVCERLRDEGHEPYTHQRVPPNDGGIALGQAVLAGYGEPQKPARLPAEPAIADHP
ncbi:MAG: Sua5/YciO/YrdC/YwlC family protein, partial [Acidobacteriota bacterium]|nr:Sua5/YciO/YrdC/YwlC family protein [Acidobacteriota bacterium]